jgi:hypothetical protein
MKKAADTLYLLSSFSLRTSFVQKAEIYARVGHGLFPDDIRLIEVYAYALLLQGQYEKAEELLSEAPYSTANIEYLRSKTAMILKFPKEEKSRRIRNYLST